MTESEPAPEPESDRPTIVPFVGALAIIGIVVIGIVLFNVFGDNEASPEQQVARAAVGHNDALQRQDYTAFRTFTCRAEQRTEAGVIADQRNSVKVHGERYVDDVTAIRVDGDRAFATVTYHFDKSAENTSDAELGFIREDGAWKVCSR